MLGSNTARAIAPLPRGPKARAMITEELIDSAKEMIWAVKVDATFLTKTCRLTRLRILEGTKRIAAGASEDVKAGLVISSFKVQHNLYRFDRGQSILWLFTPPLM